MEFPVDDWVCFPMADFELAAARNPMECGVELMVQARPNGRILDHVRLVLGGDKLIDVTLKFKNLLSIPDVPDWELVYNLWPRDIKIKRNMVTSEWLDIRSLIHSNDARVQLSENQQPVDNVEVLGYMDGIADKLANSSSLRWAVMVGDDNRFKLYLQGLPGPASSFSGKPAFRG